MTTDTTTDVQAVVNDFNTQHSTSIWVRYWTGTRHDAPKYGITDGKAWLLGGHTPVVRVRNQSSCIALTHVDVIPGQPDDIDDDSHDLPEVAAAAERVGAYIAANGDGIYDLIDGHPLYARDLEALRRAGTTVAGLRSMVTEQGTEVDRLRAELEQTRAIADAARALVAKMPATLRAACGTPGERLADAVEPSLCACCLVDGHTRRCGRTATSEVDVAPFGVLGVAAECRDRIVRTGSAAER
ncbi:hypothetical protein ACIBCR_16530 [Micromonospora echinospora]|uniref:hypothetical protein n=1 Tax=Micromonospora echinospora TaxID=1877 RepID=UPI0037A0F0E9